MENLLFSGVPILKHFRVVSDKTIFNLTKTQFSMSMTLYVWRYKSDIFSPYLVESYTSALLKPFLATFSMF